jgi:metal-sulfur cluster biosynthetic enzyme
MTTETDVILRKVKNAIEKFKQCDSVLLEIDVNERTMTHKLAEYLQQEFRDLNVDCEYNRQIKDTKKILHPSITRKGWDFSEDTDAKTVYPDIIVHKRLSDDNVLVIEAKKSSREDNGDWDKAKLRAFKGEEYKYRRAFFVIFHVGKGSRVDLEEL